MQLDSYTLLIACCGLLVIFGAAYVMLWVHDRRSHWLLWWGLPLMFNGIALTYGYAGSFTMAGIADAVAGRSGGHNLLLAGIGLLAVGLLFKVSAAPFHAWTPDVYHGAPTAVTGFMAACTKIAAFGALMRIFFVAFGDAQWDWRPMIWIAAIRNQGLR